MITFVQKLTQDWQRRLIRNSSGQSGSGLEVYDVSAFSTDIDLSTLDVIRWTPAWMTRAERLLLYTLIFSLRPTRYLEIGTFQGGSALVVAAAMQASNNDGKLVCIDPHPQITPENWKRIEPRTTLLQGYSPAILPHACEMAGGPFDFVLIDGDHTEKGVVRDANGVLPFVQSGAYILCHDSFNDEVAHGIDRFVTQNSAQIVDLGILTREVTVQLQPRATPIRWGGLRLIQVR